MSDVDAIVVGSGPNGLAAAVTLAQQGHRVRVIEGAATLGGSCRSEESTLPGFVHDPCAGVHPLGYLSPFFRTLPLAEHGLEWIHPEVSVAHPLGDEAVILQRDVARTAAGLGEDGDAWQRLLAPFMKAGESLWDDLLAPLGFPRNPLTMARFGAVGGLRGAESLARSRFRGERAAALFAGLAAHSVLPLNTAPTAAVGLFFALSAHQCDWPVAKGGSQAIIDALASYLRSLGGEIEVGRRVKGLVELGHAKVVLFDTSPRMLLEICGDALPASYHSRLAKFRPGPGVFKIDYALDGPIPWRAAECARASTVHVGGTLAEITEAEAAPWANRLAEKPFLIVCQQSHLDGTRAPEGKHTGYAYAHVPYGFDGDATEAIEGQLERFAPGFRDVVLERRVRTPADLEAANPSLLGGSITGGASTLGQLFRRPTWRTYSTPNPKLFLCSASTPPGGGVHGMCGHHAAGVASKRLK